MQVTMSMEEYQRLDNDSRTLRNVRACIKTNYVDIVRNVKDKENPITVDANKLCEVLGITYEEDNQRLYGKNYIII